MAGDERWYFTKEQLANTPSRKNGIDADKELSYRQQAANLIQDMGQRLQVTQLCINTAIVYMHRFFMFHSMTYFHRNQMALAALFLAAKVEEQPRKLEHLIKIGHLCLHRTDVKIDINSESYLEQAQDIVCHENILLQTLGFDVAIDHPHTHVVRCCQLVKACKDLAQTSYFMASNSLHLTMMCLQYKPTVVACFCIHLACKWACWEIPQSNEGRPWYYYVDPTVTFEDLEAMTAEFLHVFDRCPSRLRKRIMSMTKNSESPSRPLTNSPFDCEPKKIQPDPMLAGSSGHNSLPALAAASREKEEKQKAAFGSSSLTGRSNEVRDYREKKERERMEREKSAGISFSHHSSSHSSHSMHKPGMPTQNKHQSSNPKNAVYGHPHVKPDMVKSSQGVPQRQHNSSSSTVSRDPNQRQKPRDYHMPVTQNQSHGLPSLENSVTSHSVNSVENNKHQSMHDKRHGEHRYKQPGQQMEHRKDRKVMEDVRKTIEKNAPQKPREEQMKEDYMSHMLKQTHKPNYMQDKGPPPPPMTHSAHGVAKILKDNIKNGNSSSGGSATSFSLNSVFEDNNRLPAGRPEETLKSPPPSQPARQRSLFSPESTPVKAEIQQRTVKYNKQKTPPKVVAKVPKRENTNFELPHLESSFTNHQQQEKRVPPSEQNATIHKKMEMGMNVESVDTKPTLENFIKMEQPYRNDSLSSMMNGMLVKSEPSDDDSLKSSLSELNKFNSSINFETESLHMFKPPEIKQEPDVVDMIKKEDEPPSPMKSAKSINALLQEAIQTPSTLTSKSSLASVTTPVSEVPSQGTIPTSVDLRPFSIPLVPVQTTCVSTLATHISSSTQPTNSTIQMPATSEVASAPNVDPSLNMFDLLSPQSDDKKEHHKSEKKKKEKKHKHKDKDKDKGKKEKHKHRHKEKDKESRKNRDKEKDKEREKERDKDVPLTAAPIKITIPKDKITLSADMDKSSSGLKIKIPKERIKPPEGTNSSSAAPLSSPPGAAVTPVQAPLKIKIRTSANSSEIAPAHELQAPPSRKRDRERSEVEPSAMSAAKRPATVQPVGGVAAYAAQRPSERQNGRHYGSSSNNKEKYSSSHHKSSSKTS